MSDIQEKAHYISVTGIIRNKEGKYLICKRSPTEKNFPNKWCVPGGKVERKDLNDETKNKKADFGQWLDVFEKVLEREIYEETGLKIKNIRYASNIAFTRTDGFTGFVISLYADLDEDNTTKVKIDNEAFTDYAWINAEEAKNYDLIENILEQIQKVEEKYKQIN